ncbi:MAG: TetR-like C-terminal domain-containing protein [Candidatus Limnocylindrales bacterium]
MSAEEPEPANAVRRRRRGRSKKLDAAVNEAVLRLLGRLGPAGVTIDAVAREVGCHQKPRCVASRAPFVLAWTMLMDQTIRGTELGKRYFEEAFGLLRRERAEFLSPAVANGEIRADTDVDLLLDAVTGTLLFRAAHRPEPEPDLAERLTALLLDGVGGRRA